MIWSVTLREINKLTVFEHKALRKIQESKMQEITKVEETALKKLIIFTFLPNIITIIKLRMMKWVAHVAFKTKRRNLETVIIKCKRKRPLERPKIYKTLLHAVKPVLVITY